MVKILLVCSAGMSTSLMVNKMKEIAGDKPVTVIDMQAYGTMNGEKVLEQALGLLGK